MNSGSKKTVINNLIEIKTKFPKAIVVLGIIHDIGGRSHIGKIKNDKNVDIYEYTGDELTNLICGKKDLLK